MSQKSAAQSSATVDPIEALNKQFTLVKKFATNFRDAEKRHVSEYENKLTTALTELYGFGESMMGAVDKYQEGQTLAFFKDNGMKMNVAKRRNPYIALVEMAFGKESASTRSQRAKVLEYARHQKKSASDFQVMLSGEGGIKGLHEQAVNFFGGTAKQNNETQRAARLERAKDYLGGLPTLTSFSDVSDGFAVVLVRVDAGTLEPVHVLQHDGLESERLNATIAGFDPEGPARRQVLAALPLGRLWRAIDLVMSLTEHKGEVLRHIGIRNLDVRGKIVNEVVSLSAARNEAIARVQLDDLYIVLPNEEWHVLYSGVEKADADLFRESFGEYQGWRIKGLTIEADQLYSSLSVHPLPDIPAFRIEADLQATGKTLTMSRDGMKSLLLFLDEQKRNRKPKAGQSLTNPLPELMSITEDSGELRLSVNNARAFTRGHPYVVVGTTTHQPAKRKREFAHVTMTSIAQAMQGFDFDVDGMFLDYEGDGVCVRLTADIDGDKLTLTFPTRESQVRNSFTVELKAA